MNTGEHTQRITHKLFGIQFPSFPEYQSIDGGKVLCKSLRSQSHLVSLRLDLGEDSYIRRQNLSFEIREKWNGEREVLKGRRNASVGGLRRGNNKYALIAGFPCYLLLLFEPPKSEAELWTQWSLHYWGKNPFDGWFFGGPHFPLSFRPGHKAFLPFQEPRQCLGHSICLATSSPGNQKNPLSLFK